MGKGTEAFPDLGEHCEHEDCNQLDFLPFTCDGCRKVFCLEHRTYKAHSCHESNHKNRTVVVCEICSMSMEKKADEKDETIIERHEKSGECDPSKKQKSRCPVARCKQILTFSNRSTCKRCRLQVCLKHRFPSDHACMLLLPTRMGMDCASTKKNLSVSSPAVKAC